MQKYDWVFSVLLDVEKFLQSSGLDITKEAVAEARCALAIELYAKPLEQSCENQKVIKPNLSDCDSISSRQ